MSMDENATLPAGDITRRQDFLAGLIGEAGTLALSYFRHPARLNIETKGTQDFVTAADKAVEQLLVSRIRAVFPTDSFIGEEGGTHGGGSGNGATWIIDPIDGTSNFARGLPFWCVSVALMVGREIVLGFVHDPLSGETFSARRGVGAFCDGEAIRVSPVTSPDRARVNLSYTFRSKPELLFTAVERLVANRCDWSRMGSAALALAYVACGRIDGSWASRINIWDVAAGICLVREAGGWVSDFLANDGLRQGNGILAATPGMADFLRAQLGELAG